jgi:hypothetical protein
MSHSFGLTKTILKLPQENMTRRKTAQVRQLKSPLRQVTPPTLQSQVPTDPPAVLHQNSAIALHPNQSPIETKTYAQVAKSHLSHDVLLQKEAVIRTTNEHLIWTKQTYKEISMPSEWSADQNQAGINRIILRGTVLGAPTVVMSGVNKDLPLGKMLIKIWNPYVKDSTTIAQGQTSTIFVTGFEDVAEAIGKFSPGNIVEVVGVLRTHGYNRKINIGTSGEKIEVKTYDTSVIAHSLTKYVEPSLTTDDENYELPEIPYETQDM